METIFFVQGFCTDTDSFFYIATVVCNQWDSNGNLLSGQWSFDYGSGGHYPNQRKLCVFLVCKKSDASSFDLLVSGGGGAGTAFVKYNGDSIRYPF